MIDTSTSAGRAIIAADRYPSLEELRDSARELAARRPDLCRLRTVGTSRAGRPLDLLTVGEAAATGDNVLVMTGTHPDELVGRATMLELAHRLVAAPAPHPPVAWHFLLCVDPDGAHLADGAQRARTLPEFFTHYFRPASAEQAEWAPSIGVMLPESRILLDLIDDLRPCVQFSLHGTDVGGTFVQTTREIPGLAEPFGKSAAELGIPVETGCFDTLPYREYAPGVFLMERPAPPPGPPDGPPGGPGGEITWFAPLRHGGDTVIVEAPIWACERLGDTRVCADPEPRLAGYADRLRRRGGRLAALRDEALALLPGADDPFLRSVHTQFRSFARIPDLWDPRTGAPLRPRSGPLTEAHLAGLEQWTHRLPARTAALLRRAVTPAGPAAAHLTARLDALLGTWVADYRRALPATRVPVARQAAHQATTVQAAVALTRPGTTG